MRNVQLRKRYALQDGLHERNLTACAWDGDSVLYTTGPSPENPLLEVWRWDFTKTAEDGHASASRAITSFDAPCPLPDLQCDQVLSLYFVQETSSLCIVLAGGDLILVREDPLPGEERIEIVGSVEVGLTAAEWSPDGELLVLATRADTLLFMTRQLENSVSTTLTEDDLKASKHVSVGWGKKETQFTGRGARALRDPTMPEKVDEGVRSAFDDDSTVISWRGDGQYFALNSRQASSRRAIRVYSREGVLDSVSEPVDNLESALSWRPAGNLIASIQRQTDHVDVVFFERNGLRHGEFRLRPIDKDVEDADPASHISLKWNCDSTILAVIYSDRMQLWTMGNYHYYLKQEVLIPNRSLSTKTAVAWDLEHAFKFIRLSDTSLESFLYTQQVSRSSCSTSQTGSVAVIDGRILKLTSLRYANVPPPMAQEEVVLDSNAIAVAIRSVGSTEMIAVVDMKKVGLFEWRPQTKDYLSPKLRFSVALEPGQQGHEFYDVAFKSDTELALLGQDSGSSVIKSWLFSQDLSDPISSNDLCQTSVSALIPVSSEDDLFTLSYKGVVSTIKDPGHSKELKLHKDIDTVEVVRWNSGPNDIATMTGTCDFSNDLIAFGMTRSGALYANERCLARDCTSFAITSAHLIFTTSKHMLKFVHLDSPEELAVPADTPEVDERCRAIERGAKLVTVIPAVAAVVLQMPRGNLETIYPRALVLAEIRRDIDEKNYRKAFIACRKQRVDMNIIYDHNPVQFMSNISLFVEQVKKVTYIDLFLSQLRDENVTKSIYKNTLSQKIDEGEASNDNSRSQVPGKVSQICDAFLPVLRTLKSTNLQNIITAHVVKTPPDIDSGLFEVIKLQDEGEEAGQRAIEHICFLVDVYRLYDHALGIYHLHLALQIAERSERDPKEYIPFLQRLQDLPELRRKFEIDDYLDRHKKALHSLWALDDFDEYKRYAVKHSLYEDALATCRYDESRFKGIMAVYADWLEKHGRHKDAGTAFEYLQDYTSATESYRLALMWREALFCASTVPFETERLHSLASLLSNSLTEGKDFYSAACINRDYFQEPEIAAQLFCRGHHFSEATALLVIHGLAAKIPDIIDAGLTDCMGSTTELLADCRTQLNAQVPRIRELRVKKAEQPLAYYGGTHEGGTDIPDNISIAPTDASTTGGSLFTRYTGKVTGTIATNATRKTSKNRRKEERKRAQGKKGSVYEEEYLVNSVGRLIERVNNTVDDASQLITSLMRRGMRERARAVDVAMREVVKMCDDCRNEVFEIEKAALEPRPEGNIPNGTTGQDLGPTDEAVGRVEAKTVPPVVKPWVGSCLFGQ